MVMLAFAGSPPWILKALNVCVILTTEMHALHINGSDKHTHLMLFLNILTIGTLLPSIVSPVANRRQTTSYVVQSVLYVVGIQNIIWALAAMQLEQYTVPLMCTCICHMLCAQARMLSLHKKLLVYQRAVQYAVWSSTVLLWMACTLMMPQLKVEVIPLIVLLWSGEVLGLTVALVAAVLEASGTMYESLFAG
jgi:hypothetical protein